MHKVNHVRCANHSVQLVVLKVLTFIKEPTKQLWDALIRIRCSKVMRQQYRVKAAAAGLAPRARTRLTKCVPTLLASASFWITSWTSTRLTLATTFSLTWNGMPSTECRRSFARHARSWRASRPTTSRRSTWCRCPSLCSEAVRRHRVIVIGDRRQADDGQNEGEAREVQKQAGVGTGYHCGVPEPADPQANRPAGVEARHQSCLQFVAASLFGRGELSLEHRVGSG